MKLRDSSHGNYKDNSYKVNSLPWGQMCPVISAWNRTILQSFSHWEAQKNMELCILNKKITSVSITTSEPLLLLLIIKIILIPV